LFRYAVHLSWPGVAELWSFGFGREDMTKTAITVVAASVVILMASTAGFAETRGRHFTPEQLREQSTLVIKGAVREIETAAEFKISFPKRASVDTVVKGRWKEKEIAFQHKHPGLNVIFEQEYNKPAMGQKGTFYVQSRNGALILIGYISDTEPARQAAELTPIPDLKSPAASDEKRVIEAIICWGSLLFGVIVCLSVGWLLMRAIRRGKLGRLLATVIQGVASPFLGVLPLFIAMSVRSVAKLAGFTIFSRDGGNDGLLTGVGIMGLLVAIGAAVLFAAVMLFQALTGAGSSDVDDKN